MRYTHKSKLVDIALVYEHIQLCRMCGKAGQSYRETVYMTSSPTPKFSNQCIPVKWVSSYDGVYCSEECFKQSIIEKEKEND